MTFIKGHSTSTPAI